ncbi:MAG TPA: cell wall-binding repeat-containing protein [Coriobacteriia bacterium]|nr:cell wall-binding repeat-containing protein [Coriobacteriia bacterium]
MSSRIRSRLALVVALALLVALAVPSAGFAAKGSAEIGIQTAYFAPDMYEPDDDFEDAYAYDPAVDGNTFWSFRTFDGVDNVEDDESDYIAVTVEETGTPIWVETQFLDGFYDTEIYLYDEEENEVASQDDHDYWDSSYSQSLYYLAPEPGVYYVEVYNLSGYPIAYELFITVGNARRVWGANRFETAAEVSRLQWDNTDNPYYGYGNGPQDIVIAKGDDPADALAGGSLAAQLGGVLLLTETAALPAETLAEIVRVSESRYWNYDDVTIHVLGGESAVSEAVFEQLQSIPHITEVVRHAGDTRYGTAVAIADAMSDEIGVGTTAFVVNGYAWPDALAVAPVAAWENAPVLMTATDSVPDGTLDWLADNGITDVVIVGGEAVVSEDVFDELDALYAVERVFGAIRYETAKEIALYGVSELGMEGSLATLVSGEVFADALSAAPIAWWTGAPVLLTPQSTLHPQVAAYFDEAGAIGVEYGTTSGIGCYVLGGPVAVSDAVYEEFRDLWMEYLP